MQIVSKIDHLITELTKLKPTVSDDTPSNAKKFKDLLTASLENDRAVRSEEVEFRLSTTAKPTEVIPSWVDPDYAYDPQNPRKPNMRELMEAMSGQNLEDLYAETNGSWIKLSRTASEILYGVVGGNEDTRDWQSIMSSKDIVRKAREQTGVMHEPKVEIQSNFNDDGLLTEQIAVIKDNKGNTLRSLSPDITVSEQTLLNFGATKGSIPTNLEERVNTEKFDDDLLALLKNFDHSPTSIEQIVVQSASEVIASKISQEIPFDELAKL
ncbi:MAG: hypothetical protein CMH04_13135 [Marinovum sp.]|nr:hypothetical protein [Marinovum sp.]